METIHQIFKRAIVSVASIRWTWRRGRRDMAVGLMMLIENLEWRCTMTRVC